MAVPVVVFLVWRAVHALVVVSFGGSFAGTTYAFDSSYYLAVLREGYALPPGGYEHFSNVAFFPGLAWVTSAVLVVVRNEQVATAVLANGLALASFVAVWGAARAWTNSATVARRVVLGLALFPTSYYLWMYYSEALLVSSVAAAAWASRRERTAAAAGMLAVAATARVLGVLAGPVLAAARVARLRRVDRTAVLYVASSGVGFAAVLVRQAQEIGDPFGWMKAQATWGRELAAPWSPLVAAVRDIAGKLPTVAEGVALDLVTVVALGALIVLLYEGVRRRRWPIEPALLSTAFWFVPLCSRLVSSQVRFALVCWPVLLVPAHAWPQLHRVVRFVLVVASSALTVVLLRRLALGVFTA
jgi:hypothetical protein